MAFKEACSKAEPTLLEPIMKVVVTAPEEYLGDVMGDINSRRGQILGMEKQKRCGAGDSQCSAIHDVWLCNRSPEQTQGRANYSMEPSHYIELPKNLQESIIGSRCAQKVSIANINKNTVESTRK